MQESATFAGGCFWCIEAFFQETDGVIDAVSGYTGGKKKTPTYEDVCTGTTGDYEAVQITFDTKKISYEELLDIFWRNIDPTDDSGQFADRGPQYRTAIFYHNDVQKKIAERSKQNIQKKFDKPVATKILPFERFYNAEEHHQDFYKNKSTRYNLYKIGRERALCQIWK